MASVFYIKHGATAPDLITPILVDGLSLDLTGATVELKLQIPFGAILTKPTIVAQDILDNNIWKVTVANVGLDDLGNPLIALEQPYQAEWHITQNSKLLIVPTEDEPAYDLIYIQPSLY